MNHDPVFAARLADTVAPEYDCMARCPGCGNVASYVGPKGCVEDWNGETYRFKCCGHRAHLDHTKGGAETWREYEDAPEDAA